MHAYTWYEPCHVRGVYTTHEEFAPVKAVPGATWTACVNPAEAETHLLLCPVATMPSLHAALDGNAEGGRAGLVRRV
jgi:hypothetical protein